MFCTPDFRFPNKDRRKLHFKNFESKVLTAPGNLLTKGTTCNNCRHNRDIVNELIA